MKQGDLVRIKNTQYYLMFFPKLVGRTGVIIGLLPRASQEIFEVLVAGEIMDIETRHLEPA